MERWRGGGVVTTSDTMPRKDSGFGGASDYSLGVSAASIGNRHLAKPIVTN